jgi:4-hydroxy-3-methylbut-2-enyl diphosphate reductase
MGQLPAGAVTLIQTVEQARAFTPRDPSNLAFVTQTTLSLEDTAEMVEALRQRFPDIAAPHKEDICYATTNRQEAMKRVAPKADAVFVIGAPNSSNSQRLVEVARRAGAKHAMLIQRAADIDWKALAGVTTVALSAGASAPEVLVDEVIAAFRERYTLELEEVTVTREDVEFKLPRALAG